LAAVTDVLKVILSVVVTAAVVRHQQAYQYVFLSVKPAHTLLATLRFDTVFAAVVDVLNVILSVKATFTEPEYHHIIYP
jgi:hypothetical protein